MECVFFLMNVTFITCSGLSPGGTQVYSSSAHPESSSDCECRCGSGGGAAACLASRRRSACSSRPRKAPAGGGDGAGAAALAGEAGVETRAKPASMGASVQLTQTGLEI